MTTLYVLRKGGWESFPFEKEDEAFEKFKQSVLDNPDLVHQIEKTETIAIHTPCQKKHQQS